MSAVICETRLYMIIYIFMCIRNLKTDCFKTTNRTEVRRQRKVRERSMVKGYDVVQCKFVYITKIYHCFAMNLL